MLVIGEHRLEENALLPRARQPRLARSAGEGPGQIAAFLLPGQQGLERDLQVQIDLQEPREHAVDFQRASGRIEAGVGQEARHQLLIAAGVSPAIQNRLDAVPQLALDFEMERIDRLRPGRLDSQRHRTQRQHPLQSLFRQFGEVHVFVRLAVRRRRIQPTKRLDRTAAAGEFLRIHFSPLVGVEEPDDVHQSRGARLHP